jgi:soluble lytic murein transglycosylase-like protein
MADFKTDITVDFNVLAGALNTRDLDSKARQALADWSKALASTTLEPNVKIKLKTDGKVEQAYVRDVVQKLKSNISKTGTAELDQAFEKLFENLDAAVSASSRKFKSKTGSVFEQIAAGDSEAFSKLNKQMQEEVLAYAEMVRARNKLLEQASKASATIFSFGSAAGQDGEAIQQRLAPLLSPDLDAQTKKTTQSLRSFEKAISDITATRQARQKAELEFAKKQRDEWKKLGSDKAGEGYDFRTTEEALRTLRADARLRRRATPSQRIKKKINDEIVAINSELQSVQDRRREVNGSTLGQSIATASEASFQSQASSAGYLREFQRAPAGSIEKLTLATRAQTEATTALSKAKLVLGKVDDAGYSTAKGRVDLLTREKIEIDSLVKTEKALQALREKDLDQAEKGKKKAADDLAATAKQVQASKTAAQALQAKYGNLSVDSLRMAPGGIAGARADIDIAKKAVGQEAGRAFRLGLEEEGRALVVLGKQLDETRVAFEKFNREMGKPPKPEAAAKPTAVEKLAEAYRKNQLLIDEGRATYTRNGKSTEGLQGADVESVKEYLKYAIQSAKVTRELVQARGDSRAKKDLEEQNALIQRYAADLTRINALEKERAGIVYRTASAMKSFARYAIIYGSGYQLINYFQTLTKTVVDFQDALKSTQVIAQATEKDMVSIGEAIKDVARSSGDSLQNIATAAETLAQAGVDVKNIPAALKSVSDFALATGSSLQVASDIITSAKEIFGEDLTFSGAADQLTRAVNISKLRAEDLRTIFNLGAQTAQSSGLTSAQFLGASATLSNLGIKSSTVATGLRQLLLELFNPDEKTIAFLRRRYNELGEKLSDSQIVGLFQGFQKSNNPLLSALTELRRLGVGGAAKDEFRRVLDIRAENVGLPLIDRLGELAKNTAMVSEIGAAGEGAASRVDTLRKSLDRLGNEVQLLADSLGGPLLKGFQGVTDEVGAFVGRLRKHQEDLNQEGRPLDNAGTGLASAVLGYTVARRFGAARLTSAAVGLGTGTTAAVVDSEAKLGRSAEVILTIVTLLSVISRVMGSTFSKIAPLFEGTSKALGVISALSAGPIASRLLAICAQTVSLLARANPYALAASVLYGLYEAYQAITDSSKSARSFDIDTLQRKIAEQQKELDKASDGLKNFSSTTKGSLTDQANAAMASVFGYRDTLVEIFGESAKQAADIATSLGDASLEAGTETANALKQKLEDLVGRSLSVQEMAKFEKAHSDMVSAQGFLFAKSQETLKKVADLSKKSEKDLTAADKAFLDAYQQLQGSTLFDSASFEVGKMVDGLLDLFQLMDVDVSGFKKQIEDAKSKLAESQQKLSLEELKKGFGVNGTEAERSAFSASVAQIRQNPTAEGIQYLQRSQTALVQIVQELKGLDITKMGAAEQQRILAAIGTGNAQIKEVGSALGGSSETLNKINDQRAVLAAEQAKQEAEAAKRKEELDRDIEESEKRFIAAQADYNNAILQHAETENQVADAKKKHLWNDLLKPGGLLEKQYAAADAVAKADEELAAAKLRQRSFEVGITLPQGVGQVANADRQVLNRDDKAEALLTKYDEAVRKRLEEKIKYERERQSVEEESRRVIPFTQSREYQDRAKKVAQLEVDVEENRKGNLETILALYDQMYALRRANIQEEIDQLKTQEQNFKQDPQGKAKYQSQMDDLTDKATNLEKELAKKKEQATLRIQSLEFDRKIRALEEERKRLLMQMQDVGQSPDSLRRQTQVFANVPPAISGEKGRVQNLVAQKAQLVGVDPALALAIADIESGFKQSAVSSKGAIGVGQLMPDTAARFKVDAKDVEQNIDGMLQYLKFLTKMFNGDLKLVAAAYNSGEGNVQKAGNQVPNIAETKGYISKFDAAYAKYQTGGASGDMTTQSLGNRLDQIDQELEKARLDQAKNVSKLTGEDLASAIEKSATEIYGDRVKRQESTLDEMRGRLELSRYKIDQTQALGLLTGPADTAARQAAGLANSPQDELARLQRLDQFYLEMKDTAASIKTLAETQLQAEQQKAVASKELIDSGTLTAEQLKIEQSKYEAALQNIRAYDAAIREFSKAEAEAKSNLATNRQSMQQYKPTMVGSNADGVKVYGQLEQIDFKNIAGQINELSYAFNKLGRNISQFIVNVVDTFVTKVAEQIMGSAQKVDTASIQQARAELNAAQSELAYQKATKGAEIQRLQAEVDKNPKGADSGLLRARKDDLQRAYNDSIAAQIQRRDAAAQALQQAQQPQGGLGDALSSLAKEGATTFLKTALLTPIQGIFGGILGGGDRGSSPANPMYTADVSKGPEELKKSIDAFADSDTGFFSGLSKGFDSFFNSISQGFSSFFGSIGGLFSGGGGSGSGFMDALYGVGNFFGRLFSTGGYVKGSGTGTSDSIPAWLSNGEYVLTAKEVRSIGVENLDRWKQAMASPAKFATGGLVKTFDSANRSLANSSSSSDTAGSAVVNIIDQRSVDNSSPITATRSQGSDGKEMINIMVRDAVKHAINSGMLDRTMAANYGARRAGGKR